MAKGTLSRIYDVGEQLGLEKGPLCRLIHSSVYNLFPNSDVFESNFLQVTKKGRWVSITNMPTVVTMGLTSTDPTLPLPNVLVMAKHRQTGTRGEDPRQPALELTRMLPLRYLRLSVRSTRQRILRLQMVSRSDFFLQLHPAHPGVVFAFWARLADILERGLSMRHSLHAPRRPGSRTSSSSSSSSSEEGLVRNVSKKVSGLVSQISGKSAKKKEMQRRASFLKEGKEEMRTLSNDLKVLFYDMPPPLVCALCKGRLSQSRLRRRSASEERVPGGHLERGLLFRPWTDRQRSCLWPQETPGWPQPPLRRPSSLAITASRRQ
ncbi:Golgi-associated RAB2 interactor protein 1A-like [Anolis carolinensis]|uniref:Golgi-associated RAB2 interactor protein 1A-like n=1 Tax=Anolis carolinensis TaxID=28377 RepID=UPI002F2B5FDA